jgi:hypothetical protein
MIGDSSTLPMPATSASHVSTVAALAQIPEEDIWLSKQKSARTRRAYALKRYEAFGQKESDGSFVRTQADSAGVLVGTGCAK